MPRLLHSIRLGIIASVVACSATVSLQAAPLDCIPKDSAVMLAIEEPAKATQFLLGMPAYQSALALPPVQDALDSTNVRRFMQFVKYVERELGQPYDQLLDGIAGQGIVVGIKTLEGQAPALIAIRGNDAKLVKQAHQLFMEMVAEEGARQNAIGAVPEFTRSKYQGIEYYSLGDEFATVCHDNVILIANRHSTLKAGIALLKKPGSKMSLATVPEVAEARKLHAQPTLAWLWLNLKTFKSDPLVEEFLDDTQKDLLQNLVVGTTLDAIRRSDFVTVGLTGSDNQLSFSVRMPATDEGMPQALAELHGIKAKGGDGRTGSLPLLEPKGVIYSQSFALDLAAFWANRQELVNKPELEQIEQGARDVSKIIPGGTLGDILMQSGPYHRIVVTQPGPALYQKQPDQKLPAAAYVTTFREPGFGKFASQAIRAGALIAAFQIGIKMEEVKHDGVTIVTYRFPEDRLDPGYEDPGDLRFNAKPCFAVVDNHLIIASRPELIQELIPTLKAESERQPETGAAWRGRTYADGLARILQDNPDQLITLAMLNDGITLSEAKAQVESFYRYVAELGETELSIDQSDAGYELRIRLELPTNKPTKNNDKEARR